MNPVHPSASRTCTFCPSPRWPVEQNPASAINRSSAREAAISITSSHWPRTAGSPLTAYSENDFGSVSVSSYPALPTTSRRHAARRAWDQACAPSAASSNATTSPSSRPGSGITPRSRRRTSTGPARTPRQCAPTATCRSASATPAPARAVARSSPSAVRNDTDRSRVVAFDSDRHQFCASRDVNTAEGSSPAAAMAADTTACTGAAGTRASFERFVLTPCVRCSPVKARAMLSMSAREVTSLPGVNRSSRAVPPSPTNRTRRTAGSCVPTR